MRSILPTLDLSTVRFDAPQYLWLLLVPLALAVVWVWQLTRRRADARRLSEHRRVPVRERFPAVAGLMFWLCLIAALASTIVALARPRARIAAIRTAGIDVVILQDGSASMHVQDVAGDRWRRSMRFLRVLADSMSWEDDRIAMALFAHIAAPQVRLTKDPNTFFFFMDHLADRSPFPLEDDTTWDTNIELGVYWGLRLIDKDRELRGPSPNAPVFVLISDGEAWTGEVEKSLKLARDRGVPVFVVGVGTTAGGRIPQPSAFRDELEAQDTQTITVLSSSIDRADLHKIANAGSGQYFELDREGDRQIANQIIDIGRRRAGPRGFEETTEELHWRFLYAAACATIAGVLFLRERGELWIQLLGAGAVLAAVSQLVH